MKLIQQTLYEPGDLIIITKGVEAGMVGVVKRHEQPRSDVEVLLATTVVDDGEDEEDYWRFGSPDQFRLVTKEQYDKVLKDKKILTVPGLLVPIQIKYGIFMFGDNEVKSADAVKIAEFILANQPKKKTAKKRK